MKPWRLLAEERMPDGARLTLHARDTERTIRIDGLDLMSSRMHGSEGELARQGLAQAPERARVLIGGLGMGFTLRAALDLLGPHAKVEVAELAPAIVTWNRGELAAFAGRPLDDPRVEVIVDDVAKVIGKGVGSHWTPLRSRSEAPLRCGASAASTPAWIAHDKGWDAILLDVDNGPDALQVANTHLYGERSLARMHAALAPKGVLTVWSARESAPFTARLRRVGFDVEIVRTKARGSRGASHLIWVARRRSGAQRA